MFTEFTLSLTATHGSNAAVNKGRTKCNLRGHSLLYHILYHNNLVLHEFLAIAIHAESRNRTTYKEPFYCNFFRFCVLKSPKKVSNPTSIIEQNAQLGMKSYSKKKIAVKIVLMLRKFLVAFKYRFDSITRMPSLSLWDNVHSIGHLASSGVRARWWWRRSVCSINALIASHGHTWWW